MSISDSPALFDPTLFWGAIVVILFYFYLRGFYEDKTPTPAHRCKTSDDPRLYPNPLRGFAPSRERISLSAERLCQCVISREDAKPRRRDRIPMVTLLLSEESAVFEAISVISSQGRKVRARGYGIAFYFLRNLGFFRVM
jgi:hypothetical protein